MSTSLLLLLFNLVSRLLACEVVRLEFAEEVEDLEIGKEGGAGVDNLHRRNLASDRHLLQPFSSTFFLSSSTMNRGG